MTLKSAATHSISCRWCKGRNRVSSSILLLCFSIRVRWYSKLIEPTLRWRKQSDYTQTFQQAPRKVRGLRLFRTWSRSRADLILFWRGGCFIFIRLRVMTDLCSPCRHDIVFLQEHFRFRDPTRQCPVIKAGRTRRSHSPQRLLHIPSHRPRTPLVRHTPLRPSGSATAA